MSEKLSERLEALCAIKGRPFTVAERAESLILMSRAAAALRAVEGAATGEVVECGDDDEGQPRVLVHSTRDELRKGSPLAFQRVALVPLDAAGSAEGVE